MNDSTLEQLGYHPEWFLSLIVIGMRMKFTSALRHAAILIYPGNYFHSKDSLCASIQPIGTNRSLTKRSLRTGWIQWPSLLESLKSVETRTIL